MHTIAIQKLHATKCMDRWLQLLSIYLSKGENEIVIKEHYIIELVQTLDKVSENFHTINFIPIKEIQRVLFKNLLLCQQLHQ